MITDVKFKKYEQQKSRTQRTLKLYAKMLMNNEIDWIKLKNIFNRSINDDYAEYNIKKVLKQTGSQQVVESEILALYESEGITAKEVIKRDNDVYNRSLENKQLNVSDRINERIGKRIGLDPEKVTRSISVTAKTTDYKELLENKQPKQIEE